MASSSAHGRSQSHVYILSSLERRMCIFFVLNEDEHQKCFLCMRIFFVHRSKNVPAKTDKIYVYILRSKCGRTPEMLSLYAYILRLSHQECAGKNRQDICVYSSF